MSKLGDMIAELSPNGVKFKQLNDLFIQFSGMSGVTKKWADEGNCRFIDYMNAYTHIAIDVNDLPYATVKKLEQFVLHQGDVLFTSASETQDECAISAVIEDKIQDGIFLDDHLFGLRLKEEYRNSVSPSYLKYAFRAKSFRAQMKTAVRGVTRFYVSKPDFMKLVIPVPPIEVQREIVRMLDNFTELTEKLTAELTARKLQYAYYLDRFFEEQTDNLVPLSSIGILTRGKRFVHADAVDEGVPCIHYGELYTHYGTYADKVKSHIRENLRDKMRYAHKGDVVIVGAGENNVDIGVGVSWEGDEDVAVHDACYTLSHDQNSRYISYYLRSHMYHEQIKKYVSSGKICAISADGIGRAKIPLPSKDKQESIVFVLDRFEALCNNLNEGIPAEIVYRKKQYEYYRDMIISSIGGNIL